MTQGLTAGLWLNLWSEKGWNDMQVEPKPRNNQIYKKFKHYWV